MAGLADYHFTDAADRAFWTKRLHCASLRYRALDWTRPRSRTSIEHLDHNRWSRSRSCISCDSVTAVAAVSPPWSQPLTRTLQASHATTADVVNVAGPVLSYLARITYGRRWPSEDEMDRQAVRTRKGLSRETNNDSVDSKLTVPASIKHW